jgi:hypothetical protein
MLERASCNTVTPSQQQSRSYLWITRRHERSSGEPIEQREVGTYSTSPLRMAIATA